MNSIKRALESLGYMDTGMDPAPDLSTYEKMVETWRHPTKQPPSQSDLSTAMSIVDATRQA